MKETIYNYNDLFEMLDSFLREPNGFWNDFYLDRQKDIPFFANVPDENLVSYFEENRLTSGKALELGCGPGRNAIYLAGNGFEVDAIDLSNTSLQWAKERAEEANLSINFIHNDIFNVKFEEDAYDLIYDSGCFHHIAPHRRLSYISIVEKALKPGGYFSMTCFVQDGKLGGANISDWEVYKSGSLKGGLGYTEEKLRRVFSNLDTVEIRKMRDVEKPENLFGISDLWAVLFQKKME